jgi:phage terminase large subunit GpA-like protein
VPGDSQVAALVAVVDTQKDQLSSILMAAPTDTGAFHLDKDTTDDYAKQMCTECVDENTGLWVNPKKRLNHCLDCEVMALMAADMLRIKFWKHPEENKPAAAQQATSWSQQGGGRGRPG